MLNTKKQKLDLLTISFKGVDPSLLEKIGDKQCDDLNKLTLKELMILAESVGSQSGQILLELINDNPCKKNEFLMDINALIEFGELFDQLTKQEQEQVAGLEIQQEFNHFNRIMGLDRIISGGNILPLSMKEAFRQAADFARFLWLIFERRGQTSEMFMRKKILSKSALEVQQVGNCIAVNDDKSFSVLLELEDIEVNKKQDAKISLLNTLLDFLVRFSQIQALFLIDYFLFLTQSDTEIELIIAESISGDNSKSEILVSGTKGSFIAFETYRNFTNDIVKFGQLNCRSSLGDSLPVSINFEKITLNNQRSGVFIFADKDIFSGVDSKKDISETLNKKDSVGKILPKNNIKNFLQQNNTSSTFGVVKTGSKSRVNKISNGSLNFSEPLINANKIVIESAHLHADRKAAKTQFKTIELRNELVNQLSKKGFQGSIEDVLMIDDLHVVNRLDYEDYLSSLSEKGLKPDFLVLESSPVVRDIAIDILFKLFELSNEGTIELFTKSGNLYISLGKNKVIELIEGFGDKNVLGCVLFDTALSIFKKDAKGFNEIFNKKMNRKRDVDRELEDFYKKEADPLKRKKFMENLTQPLPKKKELEADKFTTAYLEKTRDLNDVNVVNIHEDFYRPQQAKVNSLLEILKQPLNTTLYLNPETGKRFIEISKVHIKEK